MVVTSNSTCCHIITYNPNPSQGKKFERRDPRSRVRALWYLEIRVWVSQACGFLSEELAGSRFRV